jgi:hypothetical protein
MPFLKTFIFWQCNGWPFPLLIYVSGPARLTLSWLSLSLSFCSLLSILSKRNHYCFSFDVSSNFASRIRGLSEYDRTCYFQCNILKMNCPNECVCIRNVQDSLKESKPSGNSTLSCHILTIARLKNETRVFI